LIYKLGHLSLRGLLVLIPAMLDLPRGDSLRFTRLRAPEEMQRVIATPSGIRLEFLSDTTEVELDVHLSLKNCRGGLITVVRLANVLKHSPQHRPDPRLPHASVGSRSQALALVISVIWIPLLHRQFVTYQRTSSA
jgi:hypothetical protein